MFTRFEATYLKANDPITKRALWIREQRMGGRVWRWCVLTDPEWEAPLVYFPPPTGEGQGEGEVQVNTPSPQPSPEGRGGLYWDDPGEPLRLMPWWMYGLPLRTKYESPHWNARISGIIRLPSPSRQSASGGGEDVRSTDRTGEGEVQVSTPSPRPSPTGRGGIEWNITHWPAQQGRLWGWRMSRDWAWAHGNCFVEDHTAAFEMLTSGGRTVLGLRSQCFDFLANSCANWRCTRHEITPTHWNWRFQHRDIVIAGQFRLGYAEMARIDYPTPQGDIRHCANTKVGSGLIEVARNGRPLLQLTARDSLAWESVGT